MLFGAVAGFGLVKVLLALKPVGFKPAPWTVFLVVLWTPLAVALHELGHVAVGLACGFRFFLFIVGPLRIDKLGPKLRMSWNSARSTWGGLAVCAPDSVQEGQWTRMAWYAAGGPLFSLLGATFAIPVRMFGTGHPNIAFTAILFSAISAMFCLATMIPLRTGGFVSDGGRVLMLLRKNAEGMRWVSMGALAGISTVKRPREWPEGLMEQLGDGQGEDGGSVCLLRHMFHRDRGEMALAREWLARGLERVESCSLPLKGAIWSLAAYFYAREDGAVTRDYYQRAMGTGFQHKEDMRIVSAAVLISEGRKEEARAELDKALEDAKKKPASLAEQMREEIEAMR
jgi:hypothetical protein